MADGSVVFTTELDSGGLKSGLAKLGSASAKWAGAATKGIGVALGAVTTGLGALAKTAVAYNSQMENYTTNFGVMLGSEANAIQHVAELREMAAKTPFGMDDLASASQTMLSFGLSAEDSMVAMQQLGDISLGNKERFNSLALAFSQVSSAGKLTGQDLLQMVNAGFNPLQTIAEKTGANLGDLKEVMAGGKGSKEFRKQLQEARKEVKKMGDQASEGAKMLAQIGEDGMISAEMIGWAMQIETSPGGRFYEGMLKASETFSGMMSTLQDDATAFIGRIFEPMTESLTQSLLPLAQEYINKLSEAFELGSVDGLVTAVGDVLSDATTRLTETLPDVASLSSGLLSKIATGLTENAGTIAEGISGAITAITTSELPETAITSLGTLASSVISSLATSLSDNSGEIIGGIASGINKLLEGGIVGDLLTAAVKLGKGLVTGIAENLPETLPAIASGIVDGIKAAFESLPNIVEAGKSLISGLKKSLFGENGTGGAFDEIGQGIVDGINTFLSTTFPKIGGLQLPSFAEIKASISESWETLKGELEEFFTITLGLEFPQPGEAGSIEDAEGNRAPYHYYTSDKYGKPAQGILAQFFKDTFGIGTAGAALLPEEVTNASEQMAGAIATDFQQAALEAFKAGEISYEELVAAAFPAGSEGVTSPGAEGESAMSGLAQTIATDLSTSFEQQAGTVTASVSAVLAAAKASANTGQFSSVGAQIAGGIARGISNGTGVVVAAVKSLVKAALEAAEEAAQINSPSHLFRDRVGAMIASGTAKGVDKNAYLLRKAVNGMVMEGVPDMKKIGARVAARYAPQNTGSLVTRANMAGPFNQTNNFNVPVQTPDEFASTMEIYATYGLQAEG